MFNDKRLNLDAHYYTLLDNKFPSVYSMLWLGGNFSIREKKNKIQHENDNRNLLRTALESSMKFCSVVCLDRLSQVPKKRLSRVPQKAEFLLDYVLLNIFQFS